MLTVILGLLFIACSSQRDFQNGDLIFQSSESSQSRALQIATRSRYNHMGIIYKMNGAFHVFEAVQPVKLTPLSEWIKRGANGHYVVKRLKNHDEILTPKILMKMKQIGEKYMGRDYDIYFNWSDQRIYCSELVWKIYNYAAGIEIGSLQRLKDFDLSHPLVQEKIQERYGNHPPLEEIVISTASMFDSDMLITVDSS